MYAIKLGTGAELRPLEPWQGQEFLDHMDRARDSVDPWIPWASLSTNLASATATLQRYADKAAQDKGRIYGIWQENVLVGGVMFVSFDAAGGVCEIGCWLEPAATGRGLITRAAHHLVEWAFTTRGMYRVEWRCGTDNTASSAVAARLGMTREAVLRGNYLYRGIRHDTEIWTLLAPDRPPSTR
ncbi:GNAT family N-acetyltransferase [Actinoplanes sp. NPDC051494]|uniref:GNAT family N-acetyltransferase n=1 Tax=Actinoplanes sp. NPDC051494 TaxID=3363907 RepID=UPI0037A249FB